MAKIIMRHAKDIIAVTLLVITVNKGYYTSYYFEVHSAGKYNCCVYSIKGKH